MTIKAINVRNQFKGTIKEIVGPKSLRPSTLALMIKAIFPKGPFTPKTSEKTKP